MLWAEASIIQSADTATMRREPHKRHPGAHVSAIRDDLVSKLAPRKVPAPIIAAAGPYYCEAGEVFEDTLEKMLNERVRDGEPAGGRPKPRKHDGIWCSPDRVIVDRHGFIIEEHKMTWKTSREGIESPKFLGWWIQLCAYMWVWQTTRGRFRVLWVCGNYKPPVPQRALYDIVIEPEALKRNWDNLVNHGRKMGILE